MFLLYKKVFFSILFNTTLFLLLIIGIQNSSKKSKVDLLINETVHLPISFIIGTSFISGSITSSFLNINFKGNKEKS